MKRNLSQAVFVLVWLAACATAPGHPTGGQPGSGTPAPRMAVFAEVENDVQARPAGQQEFIPAVVGQTLEERGEARSGEASHARLDLQPEGTVIRLGPNTYFVLKTLSPTKEGFFSRLHLFLGQMWIILTEGQLEVDTDWGVSGVRGSMMSVAFDPAGAGLRVTCLEGHCTLSNPAGAVELSGGQSSAIEGPNQPPLPPEPLTEADIQQWKAVSPEARQFLEGGPPPAASPLPGGPFPPPPPGTPSGGATGSRQATTYRLTNNCSPEEGVWHWVFEGAVTVQVDIAPGTTETGTLPPGDYQRVYDYLDSGLSHETGEVPAGGHLEAEACPGN